MAYDYSRTPNVTDGSVGSDNQEPDALPASSPVRSAVVVVVAGGPDDANVREM
jgi:hypothetical protein